MKRKWIAGVAGTVVGAMVGGTLGWVGQCAGGG